MTTTTQISDADLARMTTVSGIGRDILEQRIAALVAEVADLRRTNEILNDALTNVQTSCSRQELELRDFRRAARNGDVGTLEHTFFEDARREMYRGRQKHGFKAPLTVALMEEVGEVARALLDGEEKSRVWEEAIQVAAVACRIAVEGDPTFDPESAR